MAPAERPAALSAPKASAAAAAPTKALMVVVHRSSRYGIFISVYVCVYIYMYI